jgi:hypothetical protein
MPDSLNTLQWVRTAGSTLSWRLGTPQPQSPLHVAPSMEVRTETVRGPPLQPPACCINSSRGIHAVICHDTKIHPQRRWALLDCRESMRLQSLQGS